MSFDADLLVAGGGPAGLACAIQGALAGLEVVVIEPRTGVVDKACGEGLMPRAVRVLQAMGVSPERRVEMTGVSYIDGARDDRRASVGFSKGRSGWGVRRSDLHRAMLARAEGLGVRWAHEKVTDIEQGEGRVRAAGLNGRWMAVADGLRSPLRRQLGLQGPAPRWRRMGMVRHFALAPWTHCVEVYWGPSIEAYVTPVSTSEVGVAVLFEGKGRFDDMLEAQCPHLWARLADASPLGPVKGGGPFDQRATARVKGRVALVGDAAGFLDPLTGEGVRLGLEGARALVGCITGHSNLDSYERAWRRATARYYQMTGALLAVARRRPLRSLILPVVHRCPWVMQLAVSRLSADDAAPALAPPVTPLALEGPSVT
ncbi:MAG: NAD(P)/FAD-dependent oxidoreductase [Bradymonadia bacterium]